MSIEHNSSGRKLSKAVLDLKFMKKSKEKREILDDAEERQQLYQDQLSMLHEGADRIVMLNSYSDCMKFLPCRLSFGGMDPAIEKLNEDRLTGLYKVAKEEAASLGQQFTGMAADVDEEEMAGSCLASNIRKKFGMKRKSNPDELDSEEEGDNGNRKKFKEEDDEDHKGPKVMQRKLFTFNADGPRGRGRGDFRGRGRGDFGGRGGRGRGDFGGRGGRGRGDFGGRGGRGRGGGDFGGRGGRGRGDFGGRGGRGRGDFKGRGRGDFGRRGQGDSRGRGRGKRGGFQDKGKRNFDDGIEADQDSGNFEGDNQDSYDNENGSFYVDAKPGKMEHAPKKKKFLKPSSD